MRKLTLATLVSLMLALFSPVAALADTEAAKAFTDNIGTQVLEIINAPALSDNTKLEQLETLFVEVVDVEWVGRFVLGRHWRSATDEQKAIYLPAYRDFLIKHYTSRFAEYSGETFTLEHAEQRRAGEYMVRMNIQRPRGQAPVIVDYMLRGNDKGFKIFDIVVEGVSLINTQRSEFTSAVERRGLDSLITMLKNKTDALEAESKADLAKE